MGKHLQKWGFTPDYTVWTFHGESAQGARAEVLRRCIDEHGTGMEDMVQDFDDARDSDNEMEESAKSFNEMLGVFKTSSPRAHRALSAGRHLTNNGSEGSIQLG